MKISVILTGLPRLCLNTDLLIDMLRPYREVEWYIELWQDTETLQQFTPWLIEATDYELKTEFLRRLPQGHDIKLCRFAHESEFARCPNNYTEFYSTPRNIWYSRRLSQRTNLLRRLNQEPADLVIRARTDCSLEPTPNLDTINHVLNDNPNYIITSSNERHGPLLYNDHMTMGRDWAMNRVFDSIDCYDYVYRLGVPYNAEWMESVILKDLLEWPITDFESRLKQLGEHDELGRWRADPGSWRSSL